MEINESPSLQGSIIFTIGSNNTFFVHLGHELHAARSLIFDLLSKNVISQSQTTIVTAKDRIFLYNHVFNNVFAYEDCDVDLNQYSHVVNLNTFVHNPHLNILDANCFHAVTNNVFLGLYNPIGFNNYKDKNDVLSTYLKGCNLTPLQEPFNSDFIIIHYRNYRGKLNIWNHMTDESMENLCKLIISVKNICSNILIFGNLNEDIYIDGLNIKKCNSLSDFVYYMKLDNCKMILSQWSGAPQLGQFFFDKKILYYYTGDQLYDSHLNAVFDGENYFKVREDPYSWDYQTFSNCQRYWFKNIDHILTFFDKNLYEKLDEIYNLHISTDKWFLLEE